MGVPLIQRIITLGRQSPFFINNIIFFSGSLLVAALNYLYYPILGRLLSPTNFGEVQTLLSLFTQAAVFLNILTYVTIHITVENTDSTNRNKLLFAVERLALLSGCTALLLLLLLTPLLKHFLNFTEIWPFFALIVALAVSIPMIIRLSFLRGKKLFIKASVMDGLGSFAKIAFAVIFVIIGWNTFGAIIGLALSQILELAIGIIWARKAGYHGLKLHAQKPELGMLRPQLRYALGAFVVSSAVTAILGLDIIAIKHSFSPEVAGLYAGIATIARIVFYVTAPFMGVLLTMVSVKQTPQKNLLQLAGSLGLTLLVGGITLGTIAVFPEFFIRTLVGEKYLEYGYLLSRISLAMLLVGLANTCMMYLVAIREYLVALYATIVVMATIGLLYWNGSTIEHVVNDVVIGSAALVVVAAGYTLYSAHNKLKLSNFKGEHAKS